MTIQHKTLASGKWQELSLAQQLGNVGSEVSRALRWQERDQKLFQSAIERAFELLDLTIQDVRWRMRLKELVRVRELLADALYGGKEYGTSLKDLDRYFFYFAFSAQIHK